MLTAWVEYATQTFLSAPVAQLDRVAGSDPVGRGFESLQARHFLYYPISLFPYEYCWPIHLSQRRTQEPFAGRIHPMVTIWSQCRWN